MMIENMSECVRESDGQGERERKSDEQRETENGVCACLVCVLSV